MRPQELIDRIESARDAGEVRHALQNFGRQPGVSQAYFQRFAGLMGTDPAAAKALSRHWRLFASYSDEPALAYRVKGGAERLSGKWRASVQSFRRASELAKHPAEKLSFLVGSVDSLARIGEIEPALKLGRHLTRGLRRLGENGLAGRVQLNLAAALLWSDRYAEASRRLKKAILDLKDSDFEFEIAAAQMSLSTCELHAGLPSDAITAASQARTAFEGLGQDHLANLCDSNIAQAYLQLGRADEALNILLRLRESYDAESIDRARVEEYLGDAFLKLNMPEEARNAYQSALALKSIRSLPINLANCHLGTSWAARHLEDFALARRSAKKAKQAYAAFGNSVWTAMASLAEAQAARGLGISNAIDLAQSAVHSLSRSKALFGLAEAHLALAEMRVSSGENANKEIRSAARLISQRGMSNLEWRLHAVRALQSTGSQSLHHYRKMSEAMVRSRVLAVSTVAKANYLRDKSAALSNYLEALLSKPSAARVNEAIEVIRTTRAAALIDEALAAGSARGSKKSIRALEALREELAETDNGGIPGSPVRRARMATRERTALARKWIELTRSIQMLAHRPSHSGGADDANVLATTSHRAFHLARGKAAELGSRSSLTEAIRWIRFELLAPQADRNSDPGPLFRMLGDLHTRLRPIWENEVTSVRIAPEGELWGVPWAALAALGEPALEPILALGPSFGSDAHRASLPRDPRVVVLGGPRKDLPQVEMEIDALCATFPDALVLSDSRSIREFLHDGEADLVHVACHARMDASKPMFSFLEFECGRIYAVEIARSGMNAGMVTLSACDTGSLSLLNRYEPDGLVRAFLARGANAVLASAWTLDDEAAATFAARYYLELSMGRAISAAAALSRKETRETFEHPYFWASMVLFGGYQS